LRGCLPAVWDVLVINPMPVLANSKHEAVAQAYIADVERNGPRGYRSVYPKAGAKGDEAPVGRFAGVHRACHMGRPKGPLPWKRRNGEKWGKMASRVGRHECV
jgi:hypothetical protein